MIPTWELSGVSLQHFGETDRPGPLLTAVREWLEDNNVAPNRIIVEPVYDTDSERYVYTATVEWDSVFSV